ncbi:MAG: response regulator transcription factor [Anaerolineales bacterium]|nr:response regulator transcription factor [Anaerolineales bacterium]
MTILVVEDHPLFRQGVINALSLESEFQIVGEAADGETAWMLIRTLQPTIAIVDINLPVLNGVQLSYRVAQEKLSTRVILLTAYDDKEQILHAALAGACGYCSKEIEPRQLIETVRQVVLGNYVLQGQVFSPKEFMVWLNQQMGKNRPLYSEPGSPFHPLSDREMEVLTCMVKGMSNKEIALALKISHQTVKNHVTSILRKFNVEDRTQAVVYALKHGWVNLQSSDKSLQE